VPGTYFLRFGMANPQHLKIFLPELIDAYKDERVFKFIHTPVQSGSNKVLREMARGHSVEDYRNIVSAFRKEFPEITIWTDIIVGFPNETEEDFLVSIKLLQETQPDLINISSYSVRPGTKAAKMKQLTTEVKKERTRIISQIAEEIYLQKNNNWLGWTGAVIVDEFNKKKQSFVARNYAYKPIVVRGNVELGQIADVEIVDFTSTYLIGQSK
ncbi:MAG: radical SAM protein, partial [Candidatus Aenigmarchaeota archaeon]|nr:radical SAM protein [Candidatus Aenigmarchaeota archaeon]